MRNARHPFLGRSLTLLAAPSLAACNAPLLTPKGPVGSAELHVIGVAFALMLIVVIPVVVMSLWFPHRFKASAKRHDYAPKWSQSHTIDLIVWLVPAAIVAALATVAWKDSHALDPYRPIATSVKPIRIQVVSLDWKWLFIYPDLNVATVNHLVFPAETPVTFTLTSDSVVTSFFIPQLGSQIYAMPGNRSRLNLLADEPGEYSGQNQQFSGNGFADMHFRVTVVPAQGFATWVQEAKRASAGLDAARFRELESPGIHVEATSFSAVEAGLFDGIVRKFSTGMPADPRPSQPGADVSREH